MGTQPQIWPFHNKGRKHRLRWPARTAVICRIGKLSESRHQFPSILFDGLTLAQAFFCGRIVYEPLDSLWKDIAVTHTARSIRIALEGMNTSLGVRCEMSREHTSGGAMLTPNTYTSATSPHPVDLHRGASGRPNGPVLRWRPRGSAIKLHLASVGHLDALLLPSSARLILRVVTSLCTTTHPFSRGDTLAYTVCIFCSMTTPCMLTNDRSRIR